MMGDNRDDSSDSRVWGPVPEENIVGKAFARWMFWDNIHHCPVLSVQAESVAYLNNKIFNIRQDMIRLKPNTNHCG